MGLFRSLRSSSSPAASAATVEHGSTVDLPTPVVAPPLWTPSSSTAASFRIGRNPKSYIHATLSTNIDGTLIELQTSGNSSPRGPIALLRQGSTLVAVVHKHGKGGFRISRPNTPYYPEQVSVGQYTQKVNSSSTPATSTTGSTTETMPLYPYAILDASGNLVAADPRVIVEACCLVNGPLNSKEKYWTTIRPEMGVVRLATMSYRSTSQQHDVAVHDDTSLSGNVDTNNNNNNSSAPPSSATVDYGLLILLTHLGDLRDTNKQLRRLAKATAQGSVLIS